MKICYYCPSVYSVSAGGIETFIREISLRLASRNKIRIFSGLSSPSPDIFALLKQNITFELLPFMKRYSPSNNALVSILNKAGHFSTPYAMESFSMMPFASYRLKQNFDLLCIFNSNDVGIRVFTRKKPFFFHYQGGLISDWQLKIIRKFGIDCIITCSNFAAEKIKQIPITTETRVVHNGVDHNTFKPLEKTKDQLKEKFNLTDKTVLLYVGRIVPEKGLSYLIKALSLVKKRFRDYVCIFVGTGEKTTIYKRLAKNLHVNNNLYFWGSLPNRILPAIYNLADIFVLPSIEEPFGIVLTEAQACGIPIIASNTGGIPEVVDHRKSGILIPPKSPSKLASAINELLADHSLRIEMGKAGRKRVIEEFSWERTSKKTEKIYQEKIDEK